MYQPCINKPFQYANMQTYALRNAAINVGLSPVGNKPDLLRRLHDYDEGIHKNITVLPNSISGVNEWYNNYGSLFTGILDVDRIILNLLDAIKLKAIMLTNKYAYMCVCDEEFWRNRVIKYYGIAVSNNISKGMRPCVQYVSLKNWNITKRYYTDITAIELNRYDILDAYYAHRMHTLLHSAIHNNNTNVITWLCNKYPNINNRSTLNTIIKLPLAYASIDIWNYFKNIYNILPEVYMDMIKYHMYHGNVINLNFLLNEGIFDSNILTHDILVPMALNPIDIHILNWLYTIGISPNIEEIHRLLPINRNINNTILKWISKKYPTFKLTQRHADIALVECNIKFLNICKRNYIYPHKTLMYEIISQLQTKDPLFVWIDGILTSMLRKNE